MSKEIDIVTIGGGTGSPAANRALIEAGAEHIDAVAAMFDSGGYTGRRRDQAKELDESGHEVAVADALRIIGSLIDPNDFDDPRAKVVKKWLLHKNGRNGETAGYGIAINSFNRETGLQELHEDIEALGIRLMGRAIPSSTHPADIRFWTKSGKNFLGEGKLDKQSQSSDTVVRMILEPNVPAFLPARQAIERASHIFFSPGSLYGSVLCCALPDGMKDSLAKSQADVYLITNLVSTRNENHEFSPQNYVDLFREYTGIYPTGIIVPDISRKKFEADHPTVAMLYDREASHFMGWEEEELTRFNVDTGVEVITHRATNIVEVKRSQQIVRHDPSMLSQTLRELIKPSQ